MHQIFQVEQLLKLDFLLQLEETKQVQLLTMALGIVLLLLFMMQQMELDIIGY